MEGEMLKRHLDVIVLTVLSGRPAHGYAVIEEIRRKNGQAFDLPEGRSTPLSIGSSKPVCLFPAGKLLTRDDGGGFMR
jgi:hypothetical protein